MTQLNTMKSDETINSADHLPGTPSLQYYEAIIARGLPSLENVAAALLELHDRRLYRKSYGSFKEYLRWRWHLSRARGYQMLHFARLKRMSTEVDTGAPLNERQARLLDAQGKLRKKREEDLILRAMGYLSSTFDRLPHCGRN